MQPSPCTITTHAPPRSPYIDAYTIICNDLFFSNRPMRQGEALLWSSRVPSAAFNFLHCQVSQYQCLYSIATGASPNGFNQCTQIRHIFFVIWHVAKAISKKMLKASQEQGCEPIKEWMKAVRNHLYWCATSTRPGFQELIIAKWKSFMYHVANKHEGLPSPLFPKCAHEELEPRKWIKIGKSTF